MADRKLMFHIGSHKTGTTAIQTALYQDRERLAENGIHYPKTPKSLGKGTSKQHAIAHRVAETGFKTQLRLWLFFSKLHRQARDYDLTLLSAEPVYRHIAPNRNLKPDDEWFAAHEAYLQRFAKFLRKFDLEIVLYVRRPHEFALSLFKEHVSKARSHPWPSFLELTERQSTYYDYPRRIECLKRVFGSVDVRHYEAEAKKGLVPEFYRRLGVDSPKSSSNPVRVSISNRGVLWLHARSGEGELHEQRYRVLYAARDPDELFAEDTRSTLWQSAEDLQTFVDRHASSYDMDFFERPAGLEHPPTIWTSDAQAEADARYLVWRAENIEMLENFDAKGGRHYHA